MKSKSILKFQRGQIPHPNFKYIKVKFQFQIHIKSQFHRSIYKIPFSLDVICCGQLWVRHMICGQTCDGLYHFALLGSFILAVKLSVSAIFTPRWTATEGNFVFCQTRTTINIRFLFISGSKLKILARYDAKH